MDAFSKLSKKPRYDKDYNSFELLSNEKLAAKIIAAEKLVSILKRIRKNRQNSQILKKLHADPEFQKRHKERHNKRMEALHGEVMRLPEEKRKVYNKMIRHGAAREDALRAL